MSRFVQLTARDGFTFDAYKADPSGTPKGAILVIQEIFGVNSHIRGVADDYAAQGYAVLAPAFFDRGARNFEVGYTPEDIVKGRDMRAKVPWEAAVLDATAAVEALAAHGKVGTVGYCWGGSMSWLAATRIDGIAASVCYYGGQIAHFKDETPKCPVMMHFGETDKSIPMSDVEAIRTAQPDVTVHVYPAGHGFNCDQRSDYSRESADLGRTRTLDFFRQHVG